MGKSAPSAPAPPDPVKTAAAQAEANKEAVREAALMNQITQVTPYGTLTYSGSYDAPGVAFGGGVAPAPVGSATAPAPANATGSERGPDPGAAANRQSTFAGGPGSVGSFPPALANRAARNPNAVGPESTTPAPTVGPDRFAGSTRTVTTTLAPAQQDMLDQMNRAGLRFGDIANRQLEAVGDRFADPVVYNQAPPTAGPEAYQRAYDATIARNQPLLDRQRQAELTRLSNQGLDQGSEAFANAMEDQARRENDFALAAQQAAMQQQAAQFDLDSRAYQQAIAAQLGQRQAPLNELAALLSGQQIQNPQFMNTANYNVAPVDIMGATYGSYNAQANRAAQEQAAAAAQAQGISNMLGSAAMGAGMIF